MVLKLTYLQEDPKFSMDPASIVRPLVVPQSHGEPAQGRATKKRKLDEDGASMPIVVSEHHVEANTVSIL